MEDDAQPVRAHGYFLFRNERMRLYGDVSSSAPYINFGDMRVMRGRQVHLNDSLYIVDQYSDVYVPESTANAMFPADAAFRAWRAQAATDFAAAT